MIENIYQVKLVDIVNIDSNHESSVIRTILESFNIQARLHNIGNVKHLISLFEKPGNLHPISIISCHGDNEGLIIPKLAPELEVNMPYFNKLTSIDFNKILHFKNHIIINTGCCLGREEFAKTFIDNGVKSYIGSEDYIEANAIILFITNLFYYWYCKNMPLNDAFSKAQISDTECQYLKLWYNNK